MVDDVVGNMLESLCNVCLISDDDYSSLPKYVEEAQHLFEVLEAEGFDMTSLKFLNTFMDDIDNWRQRIIKVHQALKQWKEVINNGTSDYEIST